MSAINAKQREFITLRADGLSYDKIAAKLKTAKGTLIQWSKLFQDEIEDLKFHAFIEIKEAYSWNTKKKYEILLKQLDKIDTGILDADLTTASIKDLFTIKNNILAQVESIEKRISTDAKITQTNELGYKEQLRLKLSEAE